jgi:hypothetical protein
MVKLYWCLLAVLIAVKLILLDVLIACSNSRDGVERRGVFITCTCE